MKCLRKRKPQKKTPVTRRSKPDTRFGRLHMQAVLSSNAVKSEQKTGATAEKHERFTEMVRPEQRQGLD